MSVEKLFPSGAWQVCDVIAGQLVRRTFFGYTKREAAAAFRAEFPKRNNRGATGTTAN